MIQIPLKKIITIDNKSLSYVSLAESWGVHVSGHVYACYDDSLPEFSAELFKICICSYVDTLKNTYIWLNKFRLKSAYKLNSLNITYFHLFMSSTDKLYYICNQEPTNIRPSETSPSSSRQ